MAPPQARCIQFPHMLYLFLCPPSDSSVVTIVNPAPAAPVLSAKTLPGVERCEMPLLFFSEGKKIYGSIIGSVRPVWVCDGLDWAGGDKVKLLTNVVQVEPFLSSAFAASFFEYRFRLPLKQKPLISCAIYPSGLLWCELPSFWGYQPKRCLPTLE